MRGYHAANTPTDANLCALPSDRDAVHQVRQPDEAGALRTTQPKIRADDLRLRLVRGRRKLFDGHLGRNHLEYFSARLLESPGKPAGECGFCGVRAGRSEPAHGSPAGARDRGATVRCEAGLTNQPSLCRESSDFLTRHNDQKDAILRGNGVSIIWENYDAHIHNPRALRERDQRN
jgi:hypothetical protein